MLHKNMKKGDLLIITGIILNFILFIYLAINNFTYENVAFSGGVVLSLILIGVGASLKNKN